MAVPAYRRGENRLDVMRIMEEIHSSIIQACISDKILTNHKYIMLKDQLIDASLKLCIQIAYANSLTMKNDYALRMRLEAQYEGRKFMYSLIIILQTIMRLEDYDGTSAIENILAKLFDKFKKIFYSWTAITLAQLKKTNNINCDQIFNEDDFQQEKQLADKCKNDVISNIISRTNNS